MKRENKKRLALNTETLNTLSSGQLVRVAGGGVGDITGSCLCGSGVCSIAGNCEIGTKGGK